MTSRCEKCGAAVEWRNERASQARCPGCDAVQVRHVEAPRRNGVAAGHRRIEAATESLPVATVMNLGDIKSLPPAMRRHLQFREKSISTVRAVEERSRGLKQLLEQLGVPVESRDRMNRELDSMVAAAWAAMETRLK